eukprot:gene6259-2886_t
MSEYVLEQLCQQFVTLDDLSGLTSSPLSLSAVSANSRLSVDITRQAACKAMLSNALMAQLRPAAIGTLHASRFIQLLLKKETPTAQAAGTSQATAPSTTLSRASSTATSAVLRTPAPATPPPPSSGTPLSAIPPPATPPPASSGTPLSAIAPPATRPPASSGTPLSATAPLATPPPATPPPAAPPVCHHPTCYPSTCPPPPLPPLPPPQDRPWPAELMFNGASHKSNIGNRNPPPSKGDMDTSKSILVTAPSSNSSSTPDGPASSNGTPTAGPASFNGTPTTGPASSSGAPTTGPASSSETPTSGPASSNGTPTAGPASSNEAPTARPSSSYGTPTAGPAPSSGRGMPASLEECLMSVDGLSMRAPPLCQLYNSWCDSEEQTCRLFARPATAEPSAFQKSWLMLASMFVSPEGPPPLASAPIFASLPPIASPPTPGEPTSAGLGPPRLPGGPPTSGGQPGSSSQTPAPVFTVTEMRVDAQGRMIFVDVITSTRGYRHPLRPGTAPPGSAKPPRRPKSSLLRSASAPVLGRRGAQKGVGLSPPLVGAASAGGVPPQPSPDNSADTARAGSGAGSGASAAGGKGTSPPSVPSKGGPSPSPSSADSSPPPQSSLQPPPAGLRPLALPGQQLPPPRAQPPRLQSIYDRPRMMEVPGSPLQQAEFTSSQFWFQLNRHNIGGAASLLSAQSTLDRQKPFHTLLTLMLQRRVLAAARTPAPASSPPLSAAPLPLLPSHARKVKPALLRPLCKAPLVPELKMDLLDMLLGDGLPSSLAGLVVLEDMAQRYSKGPDMAKPTLEHLLISQRTLETGTNHTEGRASPNAAATTLTDRPDAKTHTYAGTHQSRGPPALQPYSTASITAVIALEAVAAPPIACIPASHG